MQQHKLHMIRSTQKRSGRIWLILRILCFVITLLLLLVTGFFFLRTGLSSPSTLLSSVFTIIATILSLLQLIPIIFPAKSNSANVATVPTTSNPNQPVSQQMTQKSSQPVFRFNLPLKDPNEFYGRINARVVLISRTANGGSSSIVGERRIGKTWLLEYLQLAAPTHHDLGPRFRIGYLSATHPQCATLAGFTLKAFEVLKVPTHQFTLSTIQFSHLSQAIRDLKAQDISPVLCIDEFEGFATKQAFDQRFIEGLRAITQDDGLILVTASKHPLAEVIGQMIGGTSPLFNIIKQVRLLPFTETDADEFIQAKSMLAMFNDQERAYFKQVATTYGQHGEKQWLPLRLQLTGQMLLEDKTMTQQNQTHYHPQDARYQVDFEKRLTDEYQAVVRQTL